MKNPQGYTLVDVVATITIMFAVVVVIVIITRPGQEVRKEFDRKRDEDVRNLTEALLEFSYSDPDAFGTLKDSLTENYTMIGSSADCGGSYGIQCQDSLLENICVDLNEYIVPNYIARLPIDPRGNVFTEGKTGYYVRLQGEELEIGACNPEHRSTVEIVTRVK